MTGTGQQPCLDPQSEVLRETSRREGDSGGDSRNLDRYSGDGRARGLSVAARGPEPERDVRELFLELRAPLCRYLISLRLQRAEAEDVAQESFVRLCEQDGEWRAENVRAWIFRVAHNLAQDEHRRQKRRPMEELVDGDIPPNVQRAAHWMGHPSPEERLLEREREARLKTALARLPQELRQCLHLRAEGLRYREIGDVLGVGTSTVAEWVHKGLKKLEQELV